MQLGVDRVRVRVPATSANLGPGFDALGLALGHHDELTVRALGSARVEGVVRGEGAGSVPTDESHLVVRAIRRALDHVSAPQVGLALECDNHIAHGRGMGSSAAAVVSGLFAARGLIAEPEALDDQTILALATSFEGHPDNAAPAILGGATVAWMTGDRARAARLALDPDVTPTVIVPSVKLSTSRARGVLPVAVTHQSAAFTAGRAALLVHALGSDPDLLFDATEDKLHQEFRAEVMPASFALMTALRERGLAATISGAGPTVLVLDRATNGDKVSLAVGEILGAARDDWQVLETGVDYDGATVTAF